MTKRRIIVLAGLLAIGILLWQLPAIIKSIPSRYVAAYLPEPVQVLAEREHVEMLPTAEVKTDISILLSPEVVQSSPETYPDAQDVKEEGSDINQEETSSADPGQIESGEAVGNSVAAITSTPIPTEIPLIPTSSRLVPIKHQFQSWNNCGPATLAMGLSFFGLNLNQEVTAAVLKPNPEDRNVTPDELADYVNKETELSAISRVNGNLFLLKRLVANGYPVIVELGLDPPGEYRWMGWYGHYLLIVAYDDSSEQFWVYDSWFGTSEVPVENADSDGRQVNYSELDNYWRQFNRSYTVLFRPEHAEDLMSILGADTSDDAMWLGALTVAQEEIEKEPDNAFLWFNLGSIYNRLANYEKSAAAFDQARSIGLPWRMLWYQFGPYEAYYNAGRYDDVLLLADVTLLDRPYFEESYYYKGLALDALGDNEEARKNIELAVRFNPNFEPASSLFNELESTG